MPHIVFICGIGLYSFCIEDHFLHPCSRGRAARARSLPARFRFAARCRVLTSIGWLVHAHLLRYVLAGLFWRTADSNVTALWLFTFASLLLISVVVQVLAVVRLFRHDALQVLAAAMLFVLLFRHQSLPLEYVVGLESNSSPTCHRLLVCVGFYLWDQPQLNFCTLMVVGVPLPAPLEAIVRLNCTTGPFGFRLLIPVGKFARVALATRTLLI